MKLVRFLESKSGEPRWGILEGEHLRSLRGDPLCDGAPGEVIGPASEARLIAPCKPGKVIAAAINFFGAADWEEGMTEPLFFLKAGSSVVGPYDPIVSQFDDAPTWGEAELTIVIGKRLSKVSHSEARAGIFGYTVANDVSAENVGPRDHHLARSKAADSFCPLGPYIDTEYNPTSKRVEAIHNGKVVRAGSTDKFFWDPERLVYELSQWMTLEPWDIILTGSVPMVAPLSYLRHGDEFLACVEGFPPLRSVYQQERALKPEALARIERGDTVNV